MTEQILIIDFGSQYTQLIARRVRELNVYCEIHPFDNYPSLTDNIKGIILSGSPSSVRDSDAPMINLSEFRGKCPVLGICYGAQVIASAAGGDVFPSAHREYGRARLEIADIDSSLFADISQHSQVWMSHSDTIVHIPDSFHVIASTQSVQVAAYKIRDELTYGIQFHPEVTHTDEGNKILQNFVEGIAACNKDWNAQSFEETTIHELQVKLGNDQVIMALSGGVDSTVAAMLIHKAIGDRLECVFVDNGLLRKNEFQQVLDAYEDLGLNIRGVDAKDLFYAALKGIDDPEAKRKAIGRTFIEVFDREAQKVSNIKWLGQGTIYPDVIESVSVKGPSATIKSHHNVGGLPEKMNLKVIEPLNNLFKDEVRRVGHVLGIDPKILGRHPFPGPGLAVRIMGEVTAEKVSILQEVDAIFIDGLKANNLYAEVWQAGAILLSNRSVGVMGDERTYENVAALRAVTSVDGMTADWARLPFDFLAQVSSEIINRVKGVNRVVYDISSKPPATIEWE